MNTGYEDDELKPYLEPEPDYKDHKRIGESASMYIIKLLLTVLVLDTSTVYSSRSSYILAADYLRALLGLPLNEFRETI